jgi:dephospho-CoA kinase
MSGSGKSSVIRELASRGYKAVDTDYEGWSHLVDVPPSASPGSGATQDWLWREDRIAELLRTEDADVLFISGAAPNQSKFYPHLDHIVLLTAPASVMVERLVTRTNNPYGKRPGELERILDHKRRIEPLLQRAATTVIDTSGPLDQVVEEILRRVLA